MSLYRCTYATRTNGRIERRELFVIARSFNAACRIVAPIAPLCGFSLMRSRAS